MKGTVHGPVGCVRFRCSPAGIIAVVRLGPLVELLAIAGVGRESPPVARGRDGRQATGGGFAADGTEGKDPAERIQQPTGGGTATKQAPPRLRFARRPVANPGAGRRPTSGGAGIACTAGPTPR